MAKRRAKCAQCGHRFAIDPAKVDHVACPRCGVGLSVPPQAKPLAAAAPEPGQTVGPYEIIREIGRGSMGAVYQARQTSMDRVVALKTMPLHLARNAAFVQRFRRGARSAARLDHPNVVAAIDAGHADGYYYFAMELVEGETVHDVLAREGRIAEGHALEIVRDVARALEHARHHDIVHRDVKPANIMLTRDGAVKLSDYGLARATDPAMRITAPGSALGTPLYMAPEQARGETDIDARADIYSLGATLFHMVTGQPPFTGPNPPAILAKHLHEPVPSLLALNPELSSGLCSLVERMMAKARDDRPRDPTELLHAIERLLLARQPTDETPDPSSSDARPAGTSTALSSSRLRRFLAQVAPAAEAAREPEADPGGAAARRHGDAGSSSEIRTDPGPLVPPLRRRRRRVPRWVSWGTTFLIVVVVNLAFFLWWRARSAPATVDDPAAAQAAYEAAIKHYTEGQGGLEASAAAFRDFLRRHPNSEHARAAHSYLTEIEQRLARRPSSRGGTTPRGSTRH